MNKVKREYDDIKRDLMSSVHYDKSEGGIRFGDMKPCSKDWIETCRLDISFVTKSKANLLSYGQCMGQVHPCMFTFLRSMIQEHCDYP